MKTIPTKLKMLAVAGMAMGLALQAQAYDQRKVDGQRAPDYATADGYDWLYNHALPGKAYEGEAANDNGVDIFFIYPTLCGEEKIVINGFRGIDDETMRTPDSWNPNTAVGAFRMSGRCFGDLAYVYAPYYRQATFDIAMNVATNGVPKGEISPTANADYCAALYNGPAYGDVTNALEIYFAKWNNGRKFILAGHSQGSAILRLVMENYFTQDDAHKRYLKNLVASYQIGYGFDKAWMAKVADATKVTGKGEGEDFDGVTFAIDATNTGVIVSYNTFGPGGPGKIGSINEPGNSVLLPDNALAVNPILWTTNTTLAKADLNLGAVASYTNPTTIVSHRYSAQISARGVVECPELSEECYISEETFGTKSLHGRDYYAYWEDLHKNAYDRITAATGVAPVVGQPTDYTDKANWMAFGDFATKAGGTDKPFDVFFLYPTSELSPVDYVGDINDAMKALAAAQYAQDVQPLETYANMYAPYYRQISMCFLFTAPGVDGCQQNLARHVGKTDTFAALDYYFENVNMDGKRPFVLVGHSQGSASLKNIFEQYFVGEKKGLLKNMIATYAVGWTFSTDWCKEYGYTFATGASDTNVVVTWNTEGPNVPLPSENCFTSDPHGQAINPLNWKRDNTYAPITANLGSYKGGTLVAGGADGQLDPVNRPGTLIVTNSTFTPISNPSLGVETYHITEFGMFRENVCDNILDRGRLLTGYARLVPPNLPAHVRVSGVKDDGADRTVIGGGYWSVASATSVATIVTPTNENPKVVFANGEREMSLAMKYEGGAWVTAMSDAEIAEATKTGDTPRVMLGVVAQRYPWNGILDIQYKTPYANGARLVTFYANGIKIGKANGTGNEVKTTGFNLNEVADGAFKEKALKGVKITATVE